MSFVKAGLAIDPSNAGLESSLAAAKEAQETDRRERWRQAAIERDIEEERLKKKDALKAKAKAEAAEAAEAKAAAAVDAGGGNASGDPLSSFFSEIQGEQKSAPAKKVERVLHDKYTNQDMGTPKEQMDRLLQHNYKWKNLNAFETLQLGQDATVEDIKQRCVYGRAFCQTWNCFASFSMECHSCPRIKRSCLRLRFRVSHACSTTS